MSKINPKRAYAKEILEDFANIGARGAPLSDGEHTPVNFRIREDGSLEKRCGWRTYDYFVEGNVRGMWQGVLNGNALRFAVCGNSVLFLRDSRRITVATLPTTTGNVNFFVYGNTLYLLDGNTLRVWEEKNYNFRVTEGYAPLYGSGWDPVRLGMVNEELNIFSNRLRVQYTASQPTTLFMLPFYAESIDCVKINGVKTSNYTFSSSLDSITLGEAAYTVEIAFTMYLDNEAMVDLYAATQAHPTQLGSVERLLLYGTPRGQNLYMSTPVTTTMHLFSRSCYPNSDRLYFRESDVMIVGDSTNPITTVCRDSQRLLAFHPLGAVSIRFPEDEAPQYSALSSVPGCTVRGMDIAVGGNRYVLNSTGLFRLVHDPDSPDEIYSTPLGVSLPSDNPEMLSRLQVAYHPVHDEIWLCDPGDSNGYVRIYQLSGKHLYRFDHIHASRMVTVDGLFGFFSDDEIRVFEEHLTTDGGETFSATAETGWLHFGTPELKKRSLRASLLAYDAAGIVLTLESEHRQCEISHAANAFSEHFLDVRVPLGRFRLIRAVIRDDGALRPRISRLALYANL